MVASLNTKLSYKDKALPILYDTKVHCCGCTACYAICPIGAISMEPDEEGFDYPVVDGKKCVRCYMCFKVCPIKRKIEEKKLAENR